MTDILPKNRWVILFTFFVALVLSVVPLPSWMQVGRPEWVAMVLIYWVLAMPHAVGVGYAWCVGLFVDLLQGQLLGLNALCLAVLAYFTLRLYERLRMFSTGQQSLLVMVLVGLHQLLSHWGQATVGAASGSLYFLIPALIGGLLWPWFFVIFRGLRRSFNVT